MTSERASDPAAGAHVPARLDVVVGDITTLDVDAIVNAANVALAPGGGVCGAIHRAAGPELAQASRAESPCPTGEARITPGFRLPARFVIHTVGPVWHGGTQGEPERLAACYANSLALARDRRLESVAFPAISTGIFGYPLEAACEVAVEATRAFLATSAVPRRVLFCAFADDVADALRQALSRD